MLPNITLVIQGFAFFAVAWLVMKFGWPHIMNAIEERQQKIAEGLAAAERSKTDLAQAEDQVGELLKQARAKANDIIVQAEARGNQIVDQARDEAITEAAKQKSAAMSEIESAANRAKDELRRQLATLAIAGAEKLIQKEIDGNVHRALLDELAAQL